MEATIMYLIMMYNVAISMTPIGEEYFDYTDSLRCDTHELAYIEENYQTALSMLSHHNQRKLKRLYNQRKKSEIEKVFDLDEIYDERIKFDTPEAIKDGFNSHINNVTQYIAYQDQLYCAIRCIVSSNGENVGPLKQDNDDFWYDARELIEEFAQSDMDELVSSCEEAEALDIYADERY